MSDDETMMLLLCSACTVIAAVLWYRPLFLVWSSGRSSRAAAALSFTPLVCVGGVWFVLTRSADPQVRESQGYRVLFLAGAGLMLALGWAMIAALGISPRDDALERRNIPAALVTVAALIGVSSVYAGANIGTGPTIWTTFGPAWLGSAGLLGCWTAIWLLGGVTESITVERDGATAIRVCGFLLASGLILGRAVAGDWVSATATVRDVLIEGWPAAVMALLAAVVERLLRPVPHRPAASLWKAGVFPALAWLMFAVTTWAVLGRPTPGASR